MRDWPKKFFCEGLRTVKTTPCDMRSKFFDETDVIPVFMGYDNRILPFFAKFQNTIRKPFSPHINMDAMVAVDEAGPRTLAHIPDDKVKKNFKSQSLWKKKKNKASCEPQSISLDRCDRKKWSTMQ